MNIHELNQHFDARRLLTPGQYEMLVQGHFVFITQAHFDAKQALTYLWPQSDEEVEQGKQELRSCGFAEDMIEEVYRPGGTYGGYIFTKTGKWEEANEWAAKRGMGETVKGRLGGAIALNSERNQRIAQLN